MDRLPLNSIREVLEWYKINLVNQEIRDPRNYRVQFVENDFIHFIKLVTKYGKEPKNRRLAIKNIERGIILFKAGRFDPQRAEELSWALELATNPDRICKNWQALGAGEEAFIKNFGTAEDQLYRVLICKVKGTVRYAWTIFPRDRIKNRDCLTQIWP